MSSRGVTSVGVLAISHATALLLRSVRGVLVAMTLAPVHTASRIHLQMLRPPQRRNPPLSLRQVPRSGSALDVKNQELMSGMVVPSGPVLPNFSVLHRHRRRHLFYLPPRLPLLLPPLMKSLRFVKLSLPWKHSTQLSKHVWMHWMHVMPL